MSLTTPRGGHSRRIYVPQTRESTYNDGDSTFAFAFNAMVGGNAIRPKEITTTDKDFATGYEGPRQQIHLGKDLPSVTFSIPLTLEGLCWALAFWMGGDTASGTVSYTHTLAMSAFSAGYAGSFGLEEHLAGANKSDNIDFNHKGVYVDSVKINGGRSGLCTIDITISGSGAQGTLANITESGLTIPGTPGTKSPYFPGENVRLAIKAQSTEGDPEGFAFGAATTANEFYNFDNTLSGFTSLADVFQTWSLSCDTQWGLRRAGGTASASGVYGSRPTWSARTITWEINHHMSGGFETLSKALISGTSDNNIEYSLALEGTSAVDVTSDASSKYGNWLLVSPIAMLEDVPDATFGDLDTETAMFTAKETVSSDGQARLLAWVHNAISGDFNA